MKFVDSVRGRAGSRRRRDRDRPLRRQRRRRRGRPRALSRRRPRARPELFPVRHHARAARDAALSARRRCRSRKCARSRASSRSTSPTRPTARTSASCRPAITSDMIERLMPGASEPGDIVHVDGRVLGRHSGILHYTIGQRRGLGVAAGGTALCRRARRGDGARGRRARARRSRRRASSCAISTGSAPAGSRTFPAEGLEVAARVRSTRPPAPARLFADAHVALRGAGIRGFAGPGLRDLRFDATRMRACSAAVSFSATPSDEGAEGAAMAVDDEDSVFGKPRPKPAVHVARPDPRRPLRARNSPSASRR